MNLKRIRIFFKKHFTTIALIAIGVFLFCGSFGSSLRETWELYNYKKDLIAQIEAKKEESKQLDEDIEQIGSQEYIERIARQYLELYYPDEQIVIPVENEMAKDKNAQNQEQNPNQQQNPQTVQDQAVEQGTTPEGEAIENTDPEQQEEQAETTEEQQQETVQEDEQATTNEE